MKARLFVAALFLLPSCLLQAAETRPNILVIMADDLGYGDVSCYGATELSTPHIDRLASEGIRFTSGYCSASTCTPTRYSMLTGTYAFRRKGTGIGLAITRYIMLLHNGSVSVQSRLGEGSTFTLRFPLDTEPEARHKYG